MVRAESDVCFAPVGDIALRVALPYGVGEPLGGNNRVRLADFILRNMESILAKWEEFAATRLPAAASMTSLELRDLAQANP